MFFACFRVSVYLSIFGIMLCICCSSASSLEIQTGFFPSQLPCGQPYKFCFEANPIWYSTIKFMKSHSVKCSLHELGVTEAQHSKLARLNCANLTQFRLTPDQFCRNSCIVALGCFRVVTIYCNAVGWHG